MRHAAQYFDPDAPEIIAADASWAIETSTAAIAAVDRVLSVGGLDPFATEG